MRKRDWRARAAKEEQRRARMLGGYVAMQAANRAAFEAITRSAGGLGPAADRESTGNGQREGA